MTAMLLSAFAIGLLISLPPGAITVATVQRSFSGGLWPPLVPFGLVAIASMLAGVLAWQTLLILAAHSLRPMMSGDMLRTLSVGGGILLCFYGCGAWYAGLTLLIS